MISAKALHFRVLKALHFGHGALATQGGVTDFVSVIHDNIRVFTSRS